MTAGNDVESRPTGAGQPGSRRRTAVWQPAWDRPFRAVGRRQFNVGVESSSLSVRYSASTAPIGRSA
jgi:hypothetical protein